MSLFATTLILVSLISPTLGSTCKYIQAHHGNGCWDLAQRCDITESELKSRNPASDFCNNIKAGQYVCCSKGSLPDFSPKPSANGDCYPYTVQHGDTCYSIAKANQMHEDKIPTYNDNTWGWAGCKNLQKGQEICLSKGKPPFPAPLSNALCGPQVPGTSPPSDMPVHKWTDLNPCPLNACCDIWGQCGITPDFCTPSSAHTGAPGTAKNGTNGCISNCGTKVVNNADGPASPKRIAYFEAWNQDRSCLHMDISKFKDNSYYTTVHWAFANLTTDWQVDVGGAIDQFSGLLELKGFDRVLSLGGWGFSTSAYTYNVLRSGVEPANRQLFAKNVVDFILKHDLEGVDFDWEYPGAQDIPGVPADSKDSGKYYLEFLKLVRDALPSDKTLSIAAPASFWYLQNFPIKEISEVVDYIVYMTYDLHGQWDYDNKYADQGCPKGGCLRSQVNQTETEYALAMITKAGVPSKKVITGLPLYGRSFEMADPSCHGPECHFTGPKSGASKGVCTDTAGYLSNFEIFQIIAKSQNQDDYSIAQYHHDEGDVLIYDKTNWVSWLSPESYEKRRSWTDGLNFGGTSDWALDLNETYANNGTGIVQSSGFDNNLHIPTCDYSKKFDSLDDIASVAGGLPSECVGAYTLEVLINMLEKAYDNYTNVNHGYDELYGYYVTYIEDMVPTLLNEDFMWNFSSSGQYGMAPNIGTGMKYFDCQLNGGSKKPCTKEDWWDAGRESHTAYTLTDRKGYEGGLAKLGLSPDWVDLTDNTMTWWFVAPRLGSMKSIFKSTGYPTKNESMVVPNPKDIVTKALPDIPTLHREMRATLLDIMLGQWFGGAVIDTPQAYSTPVFMLIQATEQMAQAKKLGKKEKKKEQEEQQRKKDFILLIVSVALIFVPIVGEEVAAAAGLVTLARSAAIAGELANGGLAIYDTIQNPSSAVVNIIGMLFGVGTIAKVARDGEGLASVAKLSRGMKTEEVAAFGNLFKEHYDKLQVILKPCKLG